MNRGTVRATFAIVWLPVSGIAPAVQPPRELTAAAANLILPKALRIQRRPEGSSDRNGSPRSALPSTKRGRF